MTTLTVRFVVFAALSSMVMMFRPGGPPPPGAVGGPREVMLEERHHDRTVPVARGDEVVLRLPMSLPMAWAPVKGGEALREVKRPRKPPTEQGPPGQVPNLGGASLSDNRYQILAEPGSLVTVEWMYCYLGKPERTERRLAERRTRQGQGADPGPFRPGLRAEELQEGMTYRVTLKVANSPVTPLDKHVAGQRP